MTDLAVVFAVLFGAVALGLPVPACIGVATVVGTWLTGLPLIGIAQNAFDGLQSTALITIPLFILAGALMERGGITSHIVAVAKTLVGNYYGSLAIVAIVGCTFFAAISGSGPATTAAIGAVTIPTMLRENYRPAFAGAVSASGGALGSLIPPSTLMIIYGIITNTSIPRLFLAGIVPGLITSLMLGWTAWLIAKRHGYRSSEEALSLARFLGALRQGKWAVAAPAVILGGIYLGVFTVTEAAAVSVVYALVVGAFVYRSLSRRGVAESLRFTAAVSGPILVLLGLARAFGEVMTLMDAPDLVGKLFLGATGSGFLALMVVAAVLIFTGTFMESAAQILLFVPLFFPFVVSLHVDPIILGLIVVAACEIGFLTPPVGVNLFVGARLANVTLAEISYAALPFLVPYMVIIILLALAPQIALVLPNLAFGYAR